MHFYDIWLAKIRELYFLAFFFWNEFFTMKIELKALFNELLLKNIICSKWKYALKVYLKTILLNLR